MATKRETVGIDFSVKAKLDRKSTADVIREIAKLRKEIKPVDASFNDVVRSSKANVKNLKDISSASKLFSSRLSKAAKENVTEFKKMGKELHDLFEQAAELEVALKGASDEASKAKITKNMKELETRIGKTNKDLVQYQKLNGKSFRELKKTTEQQTKYEKNLKNMASFTPKDAIKGIMGSLMQAATSGKGARGAHLAAAGGAAARGAGGALASHTLASAQSQGKVGGANMIATMGKTIGMLSGAAVAVTAFIKLLAAASNHMTELNKAFTDGVGLAGDMGGKTGEYTKSLKEMRDAAIQNAGALMKMGMDSKAQAEVVNEFTKEVTGSVTKTAIQLKALGRGDLASGMLEFSKNAQIYGKMLGAEATEIAQMEGKLIKEVGYEATNLQGMMGDVVKQAQQANMPVGKFMDIFRTVLPNIDLFTNRLEELTGTIKMLSKTMSPRDVKGFMDAFSKGFDQVDFQQRLKTMFVVGPGVMKGIMKEDLADASKGIRQGLPDELKKQFDEALKGGGNIKKMRELSARAMAQGVGGEVIGNLNKLGRYSQNAKGDVLHQTSAMRDMGMGGRMEALEKMAGKFTGGDLSGLGEHVAKQLGISEEEYKAILKLQDSVGDYQASIEATGRTSSVSINAGLKELVEAQDNKTYTDEQFEKRMQEKQAKDPQGVAKLIKKASMKQVKENAEEEARHKDAVAGMTDQADLVAENVDATLSVGDKIENVIGFLLEKLYKLVDDMFGSLENIYSRISGSGNKDAIKAIDRQTSYIENILGKGNERGIEYAKSTNANLEKMLRNDYSTQDILSSSNDLMGVLNKSTAEKDPDKITQMVQDLLGDIDTRGLINALKSGDTGRSNKYLQGLKSGDAAKLMQRAGLEAAKGMSGKALGIGRGTSAAHSGPGMERKAERDRQMTAHDKDLDQRTAALYGGLPAGAIGPSVAGGTSSGAKESDKSHEAVQATAEHAEKQTEIQESAAEKADKGYEQTGDMLSLMKKGIKFENSWMTTKYMSVVKDATLAAFRPALTEYLMASERLKRDPQMVDKFMSGDARMGGLNLGQIGMAQNVEGLDKLLDSVGKKVESHAAGGIASYTGFHTLTKGERVLPANANGTHSGGGGPMSVNVVIHGTQLTPQQLENSVFHALDKVHRRH